MQVGDYLVMIVLWRSRLPQRNQLDFKRKSSIILKAKKHCCYRDKLIIFSRNLYPHILAFLPVCWVEYRKVRHTLS